MCGYGIGPDAPLMAAGGAGGYIYMRKYMPSDELSDKAKVFGIKGSQVALLLDNELQEEKGIYEDGQVYLPVGWVNEYLNQRFTGMRERSSWSMPFRSPLFMRMRMHRGKRDLFLR